MKIIHIIIFCTLIINGCDKPTEATMGNVSLLVDSTFYKDNPAGIKIRATINNTTADTVYLMAVDNIPIMYYVRSFNGEMSNEYFNTGMVNKPTSWFALKPQGLYSDSGTAYVSKGTYRLRMMGVYTKPSNGSEISVSANFTIE
jgi:hypothetical protein